jgi:N-acetylglucosaminyldiphosphoundecaprenol N-acetyl-beta-D-mannosaminyltransferase
MSKSTNPFSPIEEEQVKPHPDFEIRSPLSDQARFLGIRVHLKTMGELQALVAATIDARKSAVIANHNLHSLYLLHRQPQVRDFYSRAEWTHVDGMPIIYLARLFGYPAVPDQRVTYADWFPFLMRSAAAHGWRVFYLGSAPGIAERGADLLRSKHPELRIRTRDGYFDTDYGSTDNEAILQAIAAYRPHLLLVGMGMPRQELWIHANRKRIAANVILPAGAAMDYVAGAVRTPPRWAGRMGLEWAFRLAVEPRRLWRRYLVEPWFLTGILLKEFTANRNSFRKAN